MSWRVCSGGNTGSGAPFRDRRVPHRAAEKKITQARILCLRVFVAEGVGFEPTIRYNRIPDFESGAFDHSAILPLALSNEVRMLAKDFRFCTPRRKKNISALSRSGGAAGKDGPSA